MLVYYGLMIFTVLSKATFSTKHCEYVKPTKTIILECPQNGNVVEWLYRNNTNGKFLTIFQNSVVNPEFGSVTIRNITGGGFYHLQINNATTADEGIYRCTSRNETTNKPIVTDVVLCLMQAPDNLTVMNLSSNNTIYGVENEELTLACFSKGGKPIGNISWHNGSKMLASSNENTEWSNISFILNRYDDDQILNCSVQHDMLDSPLNIPVKLNVQSTFSTKHCEYVKPTKTIILECPQNGNVVEWLYRNNTNGNFLTISQNSVVNPEFGSVTIRNITGGGFYHLQINNATTADEGIYRCTSLNETTNKPIVTDVVLCLMQAPDNLTVMNLSSNNTIYGVENEELTVACFSKGGKPIGIISWHNGSKMLASSNENTEWSNISFILNRYHDDQILNCSVQHDMLDSPLNIPVKLNVQWEARIPASIENSNERVSVLPMIIYISVCSCVVLAVGKLTIMYYCIKADQE